MINFQRESITHDFLEEALPLFVNHFKEISDNQDIPLEPDYDAYLNLEKLDMIRAYTARDESNKLIGYSVFFVRSNPHYKSSKNGVSDVIYIDKERRGFGKEFIAWCDEQLKAEGCQVVYYHIKAKHNWSPMLERMGYKIVDLILSKRMDK